MTEERGRSAEGLLGPLEYEVLSALWTAAPRSVPAVLAQVNEHRIEEPELAYTTVMTVLARLHEKGILDRERRGRGYEYQPRFTEAELVVHLSRQEVDDLLERYGAIALAQFADAVEDADPDLRRQLRALAGSSDA